MNKTDPINVLFLMEDLCFGGTQKQNLELACRMDPDRFHADVLTLTGPTDLDQEAVQNNIFPYNMAAGRKVARFFPATLGSALRKLKPDVLVNCTALPNIWGRIWGRLLGIPVIIGTCRGGGALERQHEKLLWRLAHHMVCNSVALANRLQKLGVPASRITFIPNGVDTEKFRPAPSKREGEPATLLCVARLAKDKDIKTLLEAFALVAGSRPDTRLVLVGEGPEERELKSFVGKMSRNCQDRIKFVGADGDTAPYYAQADIFCLSSLREGQPNVIMEAMASGLPVVATRAGGIPELVEEEKSGLLSPIGEKSTLAENIFRLLDNPDLRKTMGERGREIAKNSFSFDAMVGAHENLFDSLWQNHINRKGKRRSDKNKDSQ